MKDLTPLSRLARHTLAALLVFLAAGCTKKCTISGTITRGGKPIEWQSDSKDLIVHFAPVDRKRGPDPRRAKTDTETGSYTIKDVPAGEYLVAIHILDPSPKNDVLNLTYNLVNSKLRYEVTKDATHDIDLPLKVTRE